MVLDSIFINILWFGGAAFIIAVCGLVVLGAAFCVAHEIVDLYTSFFDIDD